MTILYSLYTDVRNPGSRVCMCVLIRILWKGRGNASGEWSASPVKGRTLMPFGALLWSPSVLRSTHQTCTSNHAASAKSQKDLICLGLDWPIPQAFLISQRQQNTNHLVLLSTSSSGLLAQFHHSPFTPVSPKSTGTVTVLLPGRFPGQVSALGKFWNSQCLKTTWQCHSLQAKLWCKV